MDASFRTKGVSLSSNNIASISGLRLLAIVCIVLYHTSSSFIDGQPFLFIQTYGGYLGNYLFFLMSGYLMVIRYRERICSKEVGFQAFAKKRLTRLYPLYFVTNAVIVAIYCLEGYELSPFRVISDIFMLDGGTFFNFNPYNYPTWFVCSLLVSYSVFFLVCRFFGDGRRRFILASALLVVWGHFLMVADMGFPLCYVHTGESIANFFAGCLIAVFFEHLTERQKHVIASICSILIVMFICISMRGFLSIDLINAPAYFSFFVCPVIFIVSLHGLLVPKLLGLPLLSKLGKVSMSLYFWHAVVFAPVAYHAAIEGLADIQANVYLVYWLALMLVSTGSYYIFQVYLARCLNTKIANHLS